MDGLRKFWELWKRFGHFMGNLIGRLVLTLFYFTIFVPFGLGMRLFADRLDIKQKTASRWHSRQTTDLTLDDARRLT